MGILEGRSLGLQVTMGKVTHQPRTCGTGLNMNPIESSVVWSRWDVGVLLVATENIILLICPLWFWVVFLSVLSLKLLQMQSEPMEAQGVRSVKNHLWKDLRHLCGALLHSPKHGLRFSTCNFRVLEQMVCKIPSSFKPLQVFLVAKK